MDIKKIFALYSNITTNAVNNMNRDYKPEGERTDFLGMHYTSNTFYLSKTAYDLKKLGVVETNNNKVIFRNGLVRINKENWNKTHKKYFKELSENVSNYDTGNPSYINRLSKYIVYELQLSEELFDKIVNNYDNFMSFSKSIKKTSMYFPGVFNNENEFSYFNTYQMLALLGFFRQESFHDKPIIETWYYNFEKEANDDLKKYVSDLFDSKVSLLNKNFLSLSANNIAILKKVYPSEKVEDIAKKYYDFSILKAHKNLGFSIKNLREIMLTYSDLEELSNDSYNSVRSKIYNLIDYILYDYARNEDNKEFFESFINKLRTCIDSSLKEQAYNECAKVVYESIKKQVLEILIPSIDKKAYKDDNNHAIIDGVNISDYSSSLLNKNISLFSKAIYAITLMLDSKEINDFTTLLINKLDNIASLIDLLSFDNKINGDSTASDAVLLKSKCSFGGFVEEYEMFKNSKQYALELQLVKSLANMNKTKKAIKSLSKAKEIQYLDCAALLGESDADKVKKLFHLGEKNLNKSEKSFRNFMINSVINSNRFKYIVRFINPNKAQGIMKNQEIIKLVLKDIPQTQLVRYCNTTGLTVDTENTELVIEELAKMLSKIELSSFENVVQTAKKNSEEELEKEKLKAIIGLYLTVLYIVVKSLVNINKLYVIANAILERDARILNINYNAVSFNQKKASEYNPTIITDKFIENGYLKNKRILDLIKKNANLPSLPSVMPDNEPTYSNDLFRLYRNNIAHFTIVSRFAELAGNIEKAKSFFDLYHVTAISLIDDKKLNDRQKAAKALSIENCTASKDLLYGLCVPFAYNSARYINLSCKEKFLNGYGK